MIKRTVLALAIAPLCTTALAESDGDLFGLNLTQLMNLEVVSATKRPQTLADTAAAMHVISQDDIRRSGATTLPEVLRQAPGVEVARINASTWAVTVRGFQSQFANKLLVMVDGRSVYTPLFSGVYWDAEMPMLEDIDRIEVIRGPGSSVWGSNAVNGVINIITKHSADTQGQLITAGAGDVENGFVRARTGHDYGSGTVRVYGQYRNQDQSIDAATGDSAQDDYQASSAGLRTDWDNGAEDRFTLQSDYQRLEKNYNIALDPYVAAQIPNFREDIGSDNANVLFRWQRPFANGDSQELQTYLDWTDRNESTYAYRRTTVDVDYQYNLHQISMNRLTLGLNYRYITDHFEGTYAFDLDEPDLDYDQGTMFIQDEISFTDEFATILGVKLESTAFTNFEYQPTARFLWTPDQDLTLWAAASRAIATPSRAARGITVNNGVKQSLQDRARTLYPFAVVLGELSGQEDFESESVISYELGYRHQITPEFFVDATTYYNEYQDLRTFDPVGSGYRFRITPAPSTFVYQLEYGNEAEAHSTGFEMAANWHPSDIWQLKLTYTYFNLVVEPKDDHNGLGALELVDQSPQHQAMLRSQHEIGELWEFDWTVKYMDELPDDEIEAYTDMDMRLGYRATPEVDLSLVGRDLFASPRTEFQDTIHGPYRTEMARSVHLQATWRPE